MSDYQKRLDSKMRVLGLEKELIVFIKEFADNNEGLTIAEVNSVVLKVLIKDNERVLSGE